MKRSSETGKDLHILADVTIVLPITTDCTAQGAICTSDGRKLSSRVELIISGPSE